VHPFSAVQRTNKLSNNLYTVVNNKLVRNVQGHQHNTNSSQQNIDKLLTDYETSSAVKLSPCASEERMMYDGAVGGAAANLSKTFVKNREDSTPKTEGSLTPNIN
jgi:Zn-finger domain-containing protein